MPDFFGRYFQQEATMVAIKWLHNGTPRRLQLAANDEKWRFEELAARLHEIEPTFDVKRYALFYAGICLYYTI